MVRLDKAVGRCLSFIRRTESRIGARREKVDAAVDSGSTWGTGGMASNSGAPTLE